MTAVERASFGAAATLLLLGLAGCSDATLNPEQTGDPQPGPTTVRLVSSKSVFQVGDTVAVQVVIEDGVNVGSTPFRLRYDADVLRFLPPAIEGTFLSSDGAATVFLYADDDGEVVVGLSRLNAPEGASGSGTLVLFQFDAVSAGDCGFAFAAASVKDPQAQNLPAVFDSPSPMVE
jgi:hypothetical protein